MNECTCPWTVEDFGGGVTATVPEYEPSCPVHSMHLFDPRTGAWVLRAAPAVVVTAEQVKRVAADPRIKRVYEHTGVEADWLVRFVLETMDITIKEPPSV